MTTTDVTTTLPSVQRAVELARLRANTNQLLARLDYLEDDNARLAERNKTQEATIMRLNRKVAVQRRVIDDLRGELWKLSEEWAQRERELDAVFNMPAGRA